MSEFEYKKKYIKYKKKYLNLKNYGGASGLRSELQEDIFPFINLVDKFDMSQKNKDLNFILDKKYWNLIHYRVRKELGIEPNRFSYDHKKNQVYSYLFVSQDYPLSEDNYDKLVTIINEKYNEFYDNYSILYTDNNEFKHLIDNFKKDELIKIINDCNINNTIILIPLGKIEFKINEDGLDSKKIHISRFDAFMMIRGGGNLMLCFLINILSNVLQVVPLKNLNIYLKAILNTGDAYKKQGFDYINDGHDHYNHILNNNNALKQCQEILNGKKYKYYLQM